MHDDANRPPFQFGLSALLAMVLAASVVFSSFASVGVPGGVVAIPLAIGAMTVIRSADPRRLRRACLILGIWFILLFLILAGSCYPLVAPADGGLGAGPMIKVGNWLRLSGEALAITAFIALSRLISSAAIRAGVICAMLIWVFGQQIETTFTSPSIGRMGLIALLGMLLVAEAFPKLSRWNAWNSPLMRCAVMLLVPGLLLLLDWVAGKVFGLVLT